MQCRYFLKVVEKLNIFEMYPALRNKKYLREILLPLWGQKGIK